MTFIQGLHGIVAIVVLCSLLFAEEAGVPLPIPAEPTLVAAGILIATGGLDPWLFPPLAFASSVAGSLTGYSWARLVGERGLRTLAERLRQGKRLAKATARLQQAGPREIAISRLIPGLRIYTTLVAGAASIDRRRFLAGVAPATALWVATFLVVGVVVGAPAERFLGQLQGLILQGGVLIVIGVGGYLAVRRVPGPGREVLLRLPPNLRTACALLIDVGLIASVVAGVLAVARPLTRAGELAGWADIVLVIAVIAVFYSVATRQGAHATAGETLFGSSYLTQHAGRRIGLGDRLREAMRMPAESSSSTSALVPAADRFRALADQRRLRIVQLLLDRDQSLTELADDLNLSTIEIAYQMEELQRAGLIEEEQGGEEPGYAIRDEQVRAGLKALFNANPPSGG